VILHHAAQAYGPNDRWYVEGQPHARWIEDFAVLNAPFKMSLFFLIAAYVRPMAVDRRRSKPYVRPRVKKLGGPILVGFFPVIPVLMWAYYLNFRAYGSIGFGDYYWHVCLGQGPEPANWSGRAVADRIRVRRGLPATPERTPSPNGSAASRSSPSPSSSRSAPRYSGSGSRSTSGWACSRSSRPCAPISLSTYRS